MNRVGHLTARQDPCPDCGKQCYRSRKGARAAARLLYPKRRMYPYPHWPYWHFTSSVMGQRRAA